MTTATTTTTGTVAATTDTKRAKMVSPRALAEVSRLRRASRLRCATPARAMRMFEQELGASETERASGMCVCVG